MAHLVSNKYPMGSFVYLLSDPASNPRQIISLEVFLDGSFMYRLSCGTVVTMHHEAELSKIRKSEIELFAE